MTDGTLEDYVDSHFRTKISVKIQRESLNHHMILHGGLSGPSPTVLKPMWCGYSPLSTDAQQFFSFALFGCEPEAIGRRSPVGTGSCLELEKIHGRRWWIPVSPAAQRVKPGAVVRRQVLVMEMHVQTLAA
jgi:hypothetical protein